GKGGHVILKMLRDNRCLRELRMAHCQLDDVGVYQGAETLELSASIVLLDLSWNEIGGSNRESMVRLIAKSLARNDSLLTLLLEGNMLKAHGGSHMAVVIAENELLEHLDLSNTALVESNAYALATAIRNNSKLRVLKLSENSLGFKGMAKIISAVAESESLTQVDLARCHLSRRWSPEELMASRNPSGRYILDLVVKSHRTIATKLMHGFKMLGKESWQWARYTDKTSPEHKKGTAISFFREPGWTWLRSGLPEKGELVVDFFCPRPSVDPRVCEAVSERSLNILWSAQDFSTSDTLDTELTASDSRCAPHLCLRVAFPTIPSTDQIN
ncbi:hypothetical protein CYMTET_38219, partial [Cymbomonas tetramitiformis]